MDQLQEILDTYIAKDLDFILTQFPSIENEIQNIFNKIISADSIDAAEPFLKILENTQFLLAKMAFKDGILLSPGLRKFVYDFDRLDDVGQRKYLLSMIKSGGTYFSNCQ